MAGYKIPTLLNNFNTYASGHKYVGVSSETTLPNFEYLTYMVNVLKSQTSFSLVLERDYLP